MEIMIFTVNLSTAFSLILIRWGTGVSHATSYVIQVGAAS
jgi:hypothetical protein